MASANSHWGTKSRLKSLKLKALDKWAVNKLFKQRVCSLHNVEACFQGNFSTVQKAHSFQKFVETNQHFKRIVIKINGETKSQKSATKAVYL